MTTTAFQPKCHWALWMLAGMLAGCGGGGGTGSVTAPTPPSPTPVPTITPTPTATPAGRWQPTIATTWHWQLSGTIDPRHAVDAYDIDLFDTSAATIAQLHGQNHRVICYFSAGSSENWRPDDAQFAESDRGLPLDGWVGERWLSITSPGVRRVMTARLDLARSKGCDAVEPDNVDGYANRNGLNLTAAQQLDYNRFLADEAHARGLAVALKNDVDQVVALQPAFDFAINEQCHEYDECVDYAAFLRAGKPVLNAEYRNDYRTNSGGARDRLCAAATAQGLRTLVLPLELDGSFRFSCDAP
ncbi:endo alpha-1,4 polygalactosaminidase [Sphingomonas sp. CFBP 13720]|uniref:endo alpha-1,4 polygalactosaminidase n=1 Tax=Sphingomonas sp. CFBP 13720 TaxID=2775302 RepID=UPI00177F4258|nr:endo alpha-1,4 polygalactosaminidase [Sphingomonas sp. CFBP 13720]MBD8678699.1 endo alpha-1,4 polygalactosaminidase [Sphingomonas sp. CFBP 13720]